MISESNLVKINFDIMLQYKFNDNPSLQNKFVK